MNGELFDEVPLLETIPMADADVRFMRRFYGPALAAQHMRVLLDEIAWRQETIVLWGQQHLQPRLSAWYGDAGSRYSYSGITLEPHPWTATLLRIKGDIEQVTGHRFNSVLLNLYRNERDGMGWHSDDEAELGPEPVIASLSLGEARIFHFRHRTRKTGKPISLTLIDGSLLVMAGTTQKFWRHAVDKESVSRDARINLTFRHIVPAR
ncbi:alpha-ketoglutarate-dependent dioxygenase AlkB [Noviherbaspirillum cavernae]|uniref:Alpha-ketoglutarate-dependent dioxygenase AlkB n=1 Tax=Noviherbaspirillum cavernae TaxID=2320862 RepID=A0A418X325_9BURK|nr:alpha-ketoglutarate-dependent dioxygenase AlkB [Noviherbaspirillum cavernae]RJG06878.1 alpha-ketoglutarate-dependent dioxygenase AlkB [Noviherbaspirillum cavernae]